MSTVNVEKLDELFKQEDSTSDLPVLVDEKKNLPVERVEEKPVFDLSNLTNEKELEEFIKEKASKNIESAEEILDELKAYLKKGYVSERMFEAASAIVNSISTSVAEMNKLKAQKERFKIDRARTAIDAVKKTQGEFQGNIQAGKIVINKNQTVVASRNDILKKLKGKEDED